MKLQIEPFQVPLKVPIKTKYGTFTHRRGCYAHLILNNSIVSTAELSPLEGFSEESLDDAITQLQSTFDKFINSFQSLCQKPSNMSLFAKLHNLFPSVTFCLLSFCLSNTQAIANPYQGLISGDFNTSLKQACELKELGFTHVKIKLSHFTPYSVISLLRRLKHSVFSNSVKLRLDFSGAFSLKELILILKSFSPNDFDYIEDVSLSLDTLKKLSTHFPFPIGCDELLRLHSYESLLQIPTVKAFIIKPTIDMSYLLKSEIPKNIQIILSSSYETGVGLSQILKLSNAFNLKGPHGIDTFSHLDPKYYASKITVNPPQVSTVLPKDSRCFLPT